MSQECHFVVGKPTTGRDIFLKHCWKRIKCCLTAFSQFPTIFSKGHCQGSLQVDVVWQRVNVLPHIPEFLMILGQKPLENNVGKE